MHREMAVIDGLYVWRLQVPVNCVFNHTTNKFGIRYVIWQYKNQQPRVVCEFPLTTNHELPFSAF